MSVSENPLFKKLCESVSEETDRFTFACGGSIPIVSELSEPENAAREPKDQPTWDAINSDPDELNLDDPPARPLLSLPVDLRWDSADKAALSGQTKVTFPLTPETEANLARLVGDCEAATFGRGNEDVLDLTYRKAGKMDPTRFSSTFNPYELGIMDTISQVLLPTLRQFQPTRAVRAELYKLNFYSAPSGKFKAHVDTPRASDHVGTLVVCLPLDHQGGTLNVNHKGQTVAFDWGTSSDKAPESPSIKWAAFYGDCEHEVLEVTEGHRLTLTYNLYVVRGNGSLGGNAPALDPTTLPLHDTVRDLVQSPGLWDEGGHIGYFCSHAYPHTAATKLIFMAPDNLKGADMAMYSIFRSLGLSVSFRPAFDEMIIQNDNHPGPDPEDADEAMILGAEGALKREEDFEEDFDEWIGRKESYWAKDTLKYWHQPIMKRIPGYVGYKDVHWVNKPGYKEAQLSWIAYGNESSIGWAYSRMVMVARIGEPERRQVEVEAEAEDDAKYASSSSG